MSRKVTLALIGLVGLVGVGSWAVDQVWPGVLTGRDPAPDVLFPVLVHGKVGYIDRTGRMVLPARYEPIADAITMASPYEYLMYTRRIGWACDFHAGRCLVRTGAGLVCVDTAGRPCGGLLPPESASPADRAPGLHGWYCLEPSGDRPVATIAQSWPEGVGPYSCGLAPARQEKLWGYVDPAGAWVIPPRYTVACPFTRPDVGGEGDDRLAVVQPPPTRPGFVRAGIIDTAGGFRTPAVLDAHIQTWWGLQFSEGRARICRRMQVGFVGPDGRVVIPPQFDGAEPFHNGLARVMVIDRQKPGILARWLGKLGLLPKLGTRQVMEWGYVDRTGRWIWRPTR